jgi:hypothetical protein
MLEAKQVHETAVEVGQNKKDNDQAGARSQDLLGIAN